MNLTVRNYYRGEKDLEDLKIEKYDIEYSDIDEAYDKYVTPEIEGYILLNWVITEKK